MTEHTNYHLTLGTNGTEDEITIMSPQGKSLAFIWLWDEEDDPAAAEAKASAKLIVNALNAFDPSGKKCLDCHATLPGMLVVSKK
jgi:hypothetical protein